VIENVSAETLSCGPIDGSSPPGVRKKWTNAGKDELPRTNEPAPCSPANTGPPRHSACKPSMPVRRASYLTMVRIARIRQAGVMPQLPTPLRAALGLVATALDEARHLPDRAIELPMLAVSTALQMSLRAQQRYARLAARGDEVLNGRETTDDPPSWATFDEPVAVEKLNVTEDKPKSPRKAVPRPRSGKPSAFDAIGDE
jgi:hypothetical protein